MKRHGDRKQVLCPPSLLAMVLCPGATHCVLLWACVWLHPAKVPESGNSLSSISQLWCFSLGIFFLCWVLVRAVEWMLPGGFWWDAGLLHLHFSWKQTILLSGICSTPPPPIKKQSQFMPVSLNELYLIHFQDESQELLGGSQLTFCQNKAFR